MLLSEIQNHCHLTSHVHLFVNKAQSWSLSLQPFDGFGMVWFIKPCHVCVVKMPGWTIGFTNEELVQCSLKQLVCMHLYHNLKKTNHKFSSTQSQRLIYHITEILPTQFQTKITDENYRWKSQTIISDDNLRRKSQTKISEWKSQTKISDENLRRKF